MERLDFDVERSDCAWPDATICPTFDVAVDDTPALDDACLEGGDAMVALWGFSGCLVRSWCGQCEVRKNSPELALSTEICPSNSNREIVQRIWELSA